MHKRLWSQLKLLFRWQDMTISHEDVWGDIKYQAENKRFMEVLYGSLGIMWNQIHKTCKGLFQEGYTALVFFFWFFCKVMSLSYQVQLAKICSQAIPLEKAINNGKGRGHETSSRHAAKLTMKGSPPPLSSACILFAGCSKKYTWKSVPERMDSRCSGFVERLGINWGDGCESEAEGQRPERAQLHSAHGRASILCPRCQTRSICQVFLFN